MIDRKSAAPLLMALSGASALAYETVWMRQLSRAFGVTVYAVAGLVALYMGGLALGAALAARRRGSADWLRLYGWLEAAAGLTALAATWWLAQLPALVGAWSAEAPLSSAARLLLAAPALLPPTMLLGATLPVLARDGADASFLYGANTLGALAGLLAAAFVVLGAWGETATVALAVLINLGAAAAALGLSRVRSVKPAGAAGDPSRARGAVPFFVVSGFCAMGCEVLWSRQLIPLLGNSTYAFALILAVYLAGLGLGSCLRLKSSRPWTSLAFLLGALGAAIVLSGALTRFIGLQLDSPDFLYTPLRSLKDFPMIGFQALVLVFPSAFVLGLMFPAALRLSGDDAAAVGRLYAWNTVGGIAGSLACGFWGLSLLGGHACLMGLGLLAAASAFAAAAFARRREAWAAAGGCAALTAAFLAYGSADPSVDILVNRLKTARGPDPRVLFHDESPAAGIVGIESGVNRTLFINGIATSGRGRVGELMALIPNLAVAEPRTTLVICFGAGNTFRAASRLGTAVDGVELVADVVRRMPDYYDDAAAVLARPGNRVFIEDGRSHLLRSRRRYDAIIVDAAPPLYSAGAVNLYTREFLDLAREHLTDEGVFTLWLPTLSFESDYWRILRSFCDAFPHAAVWQQPGMSGFLVLGSQRALAWPPGELERRIRARARQALAWPNLDEDRVRAGFWLPEADLRAHVARYEPLTDDRPSVEFPLARFWRGEPILPDTAFLRKALR